MFCKLTQFKIPVIICNLNLAKSSRLCKLTQFKIPVIICNLNLAKSSRLTVQQSYVMFKALYIYMYIQISLNDIFNLGTEPQLSISGA